jgi:hypothetical protein
MKSVRVRDNILYGTFKRYDFYSYDNFKCKKIDSEYPYSQGCYGYFQLYKHKKDKLYDESYNCGDCDGYFHRHFSQRQIIRNLIVYHLGKAGVNWNKRINKNDFLY